jgi:hypothetical protein
MGGYQLLVKRVVDEAGRLGWQIVGPDHVLRFKGINVKFRPTAEGEIGITGKYTDTLEAKLVVR